MVENVSRKLTVEEAVKLGLEPCKICRPASLQPELGVMQKPQGRAASTTQCKGITAKGARCKHMTSIANGYCFQHNPDKKKN